MIDTNLLLVLVVGGVNPLWVERFKRTNEYTFDDFQRLKMLVEQSAGLVSTPNVLTEVSNLINAATGDRRMLMYDRLRSLVSTLQEIYVPSLNTSMRQEFVDFGLTDLGIGEAALNTNGVVVTDDLRLAGHLIIEQVEVLNYNRLR